MFTVNKVPGFAAQMRRENRSVASSSSKRDDINSSEKTHENGLRSRDNSPKMPRPRSEEIPLEDMRLRKASLTSNGINIAHMCQERRDSQGSNNSELSSVIRKHSEETSFTSPQGQESKSRRKGQLETV